MRAQPHEILGIEEAASPERVRSRYRELARRYHPDANGGDATAEWVFKSINEAHREVRQRQQGGRRAQTPSPTQPSTGPRDETHSQRDRRDDPKSSDGPTARSRENPLRETGETVIAGMGAGAIAALASHATGASATAGQWMGTTESTAVWAITGATAFATALVISTWTTWREAAEEAN